MSDAAMMSDGELVLELVMQGLRTRDERLNEVATEFLLRRRAQSLPRLAWEALNAKNKTAFRIRLMEIIARMGEPYGEAVFDLTGLHHVPIKAIREAAQRLFPFSQTTISLCGLLQQSEAHSG